jgi:hypothetical protein
MSINVLDTSPRRMVWRQAFPIRGELLLLAEGDLKLELKPGSIVFIHETDFACDVSDEHIKNARRTAIARSYGGDAEFAEEVCCRIVSLRQQLRLTPIASQPTLLLYSGDSSSVFAGRKPAETILKTVLPAYSSENVVLLPQKLNQSHSPADLRRIVQTCVYSLANHRRLPDDLQIVTNCMATLEALKVFNNDTNSLLAQFEVAGQRDALARYLNQDVEPDPGMLLEFSCSVEQAARNLAVRA